MDELIEEFGEMVIAVLFGMIVIYVFTFILEMVV